MLEDPQWRSHPSYHRRAATTTPVTTKPKAAPGGLQVQLFALQLLDLRSEVLDATRHLLLASHLLLQGFKRLRHALHLPVVTLQGVQARLVLPEAVLGLR